MKADSWIIGGPVPPAGMDFVSARCPTDCAAFMRVNKFPLIETVEMHEWRHVDAKLPALMRSWEHQKLPPTGKSASKAATQPHSTGKSASKTTMQHHSTETSALKTAMCPSSTGKSTSQSIKTDKEVITKYCRNHT